MAAPLLMGGLLDAAASRLVVVDIQGRLAQAMTASERERVLRQCGIMLEAARLLGVPVTVTEQYPKGLGATEAELLQRLPPATAVLEKTCFACSGAPAFMEELTRGAPRRQVVLAGMETHVCVLQTAIQLREAGYEVFVVEDAVCSRREDHRRNGLERMRAGGVVITNSESVVFEWLRDASHPHFKAISALLK